MSYELWCHCCVCGEGYPEGASHKCDPKKLARIDVAMKRDYVRGDTRTYAEKINQGFQLMSMSGDMEFNILDWDEE